VGVGFGVRVCGFRRGGCTSESIAALAQADCLFSIFMNRGSCEEGAHVRLIDFVSLNSRLESNREEEEDPAFGLELGGLLACSLFS